MCGIALGAVSSALAATGWLRLALVPRAFLALLLGPGATLQAIVFARLQRVYARQGYGRANSVELLRDELVHHDGDDRHAFGYDRIRRVQSVRHFVLVEINRSHGIAIPMHAIGNPRIASAFAGKICGPAGIPHDDSALLRERAKRPSRDGRVAQKVFAYAVLILVLSFGIYVTMWMVHN